MSSFGLASEYQWIFDSQITLEMMFGGGKLNIDSDNPELEFLGDIDFLPH
jgi:hypothetical protein